MAECGAGTVEKRVSWVELFFDLVFVFAVTQASELLHDDSGWQTVARTAAVFVPVYWLWVGTTIHANLHDLARPRQLVPVLAVALGGLLMATAVPAAFEDGSGEALLFAAAYWASRMVLLLAVRGLDQRRAFVSFTVAAIVTGPLLVLGALFSPGVRLAVWCLAGLVDLSVPLAARRRLADVTFDPGHLVERYGTFVLIALGETIVASGVAVAEFPIGAGQVVAMLVAFAVTAELWWLYFVFASGAIRGALARGGPMIELIRPVLSYGHLGLIGGVMALAAGIGPLLEEPGVAPEHHSGAAVCAGVAIYLGTFAFTRWRISHTVAVPRIVGAVASLALIPLVPHLVGVVLLLVLAAVLLGVIVADHRYTPAALRHLPES